MKLARFFFLFILPALKTVDLKAQHIIKNSLCYNSILQNNSNSYFSVARNLIYEIGYEQFINSRVSLSLTGSISAAANNESISLYPTSLSYGRVIGLNYEVKYFFAEEDGLYNEGGYIASNLSWRTIKERIDGPYGVMNTKITVFPYTLKIGHRAISNFIGLFIDYYAGLGVNLSTQTNRGAYSGSNIPFGKPASLPFTAGFTMGYVF